MVCKKKLYAVVFKADIILKHCWESCVYKNYIQSVSVTFLQSQKILQLIPKQILPQSYLDLLIRQVEPHRDES